MSWGCSDCHDLMKANERLVRERDRLVETVNTAVEEMACSDSGCIDRRCEALREVQHRVASVLRSYEKAAA